VVTLPICGVIADYLGWRAVFYFTGGVSVAFSFVWILFVHEAPGKHPRISTVRNLRGWISTKI
jgi:predicted MFS family arabinose efflux permease